MKTGQKKVPRKQKWSSVSKRAKKNTEHEKKHKRHNNMHLSLPSSKMKMTTKPKETQK